MNRTENAIIDAFLQLFRRKAILHIYHSVHCEVFLKELDRLCLYATTQYIDTTTGELSLLPKDREFLIRFYKCALVGILLDWLNEGMHYDLLASFTRICDLFNGSDQQEGVIIMGDCKASNKVFSRILESE